MTRARCPRGTCRPRAVRAVRGGAAEVCQACGDRFPCRRPACGHIDCHEARGEALPPGVYLAGTYHPEAATASPEASGATSDTTTQETP